MRSNKSASGGSVTAKNVAAKSDGQFGSRHAVPVPPSAFVLLNQARIAWAEAALEARATDKYRASHVAALRGAAALLATRARPTSSPRHRPTSAWVLLDQIVPELADWSAYFADSARRRAAIEAGVTSIVTDRDADDLMRAAGEFIGLVDHMISSAPLVAAS